jgi:cytochrome c oxidase cbb3-type subunit 3
MRNLTGLGLILWIGILLFGLGLMPRMVQAQTPGGSDLEFGAKLYADNCAVCHGTDGQGRIGVRLAKDWPSIRPDQQIRTVIENGIQGSVMPAWGQSAGGPLSEIEIQALVDYILNWETGGPPVIHPMPTPIPHPALTPPPGVTGDPNQGALLFDQNCVVCHGPNGQGRIGAVLVKNWPSIRPDLSIKNTIRNGIQGSVMPAWSQANGGPLSEAQINDLVAFILAKSSTVEAETSEGAHPLGQPSWFSGWTGVIFSIVVFFLIIVAVVWFQSRS